MSDRKSGLYNIFLIIGPGILVAATGVGAGDLATAAFTGNKLGVAVLWAVVFGAFLKYVINEGLARWQLATGDTLLEGAVRHLGRPFQFVFFPYLMLWSFFVGSALISACGVAMHAILPVFKNPDTGKIVFGILHSLVGVSLVLAGGFKLFKNIMVVCIGIMFFVVVTTAAIICKDWGSVVSGLLVPGIPQLEGPGLSWTVALMGGVGGTLTVMCYSYWMSETGRSGVEQLKTCRIDLGLAYGATAVFGISMVIIGSSISLLPPGSGATLVVQLANLLEESLGPVGKWAFLLGAWSAIFSSLFGVWQALPYLFADFWKISLSDREADETNELDTEDLTGTKLYKGFLFGIAIVPMLGLFLDFSQIQKIYAVFGALFMPLLAVILIILNGRRVWVGDLINRKLTVGVLVGTLVLFLIFGFLQVRVQLGF
jgi:Mn2+/Fe2+ NRAMP family transporter